MITNIKVDGFKSLSKFNMDLQPGLNILVGPNGAGKTNIILFFEFLSNLINGNLSEAISRTGGAGSILRKIGEETYQKHIDVEITGHLKITSKKIMNYCYIFKIELSSDNLIYYKNQRLIIKFYKISKNRNLDSKIFETILDIEQKTKPELKSEIILNKYNRSELRSYLFPKRISDKNFEKSIKNIFLEYNLLSNSLVTAINRIFDFRYMYGILYDLRGGAVFNIIPSEVKKPEDVAKAPGIQKDGSGLAATFYAMEARRSRDEYYEDSFFYRQPFYERDIKRKVLNEQTFNKIIENIKLANPSITNIQIENEPFSNNLNVKISIKEGNKEAILPLSLMSDGTIKWMTLITAIFTCRNFFSVEEPENFLHPWMQAEILKIIRNNINQNSFVLMTTHSESLLNAAKPEEIVIINMKDGRSSATRIRNIKSLKEEISNTGFGVGYFYFADGLNIEV